MKAQAERLGSVSLICPTRRRRWRGLMTRLDAGPLLFDGRRSRDRGQLDDSVRSGLAGVGIYSGDEEGPAGGYG